MVKRIAGMMICFFCFAMPLRAEIPLPEDATLFKVVKSDASSPNPMQFTIKMYHTSLSLNKLNDFFIRAMQQSGWHEDKSLKDSLRFRNGQLMVMIVPLPTLAHEGKIAFTVSEGKIPSKEEFMATKKDKPDELIFMPLYPNAKQLLLWDLPTGGVSAAYVTTDAIQDVLFFYKAKMLAYGWFLADEAPIVKAPTAYNPELPKRALDKKIIKSEADLNIKGEKERTSLTFKKPTGESCLINLFSVRIYTDSMMINKGKQGTITEQEIKATVPASSSKTEILVTYNEYKKVRK